MGDDTVSLYALSQEFSQDEETEVGESDGKMSVTDRSHTRLKSVVVVPQGTGSANAIQESLQLNPVLRAALSSAHQRASAKLWLTMRLWLSNLDQKVISDLMEEGFSPPENAVFLRVQRANEEIFSPVEPPVQAQDHSTQRWQTYVCTGAVQTAQVLDTHELVVGSTITQELVGKARSTRRKRPTRPMSLIRPSSSYGRFVFSSAFFTATICRDPSDSDEERLRENGGLLRPLVDTVGQLS